MGTRWVEFGDPVEEEPKVFRQTSWTTDTFGTQGLRFGQVAWYPNGSFGLARSKGVGDPPCIFTSPAMAYPRTIAIGDEWETSVRCRGDDDDVDPTVGTSEVIRKDAVTVAGIDVETFVIRSKLLFNALNLRISNEGESWYSPDYKLAIKSDILVNNYDPDGSNASSGTLFISELVSLTPSQEPLETFPSNTGR